MSDSGRRAWWFYVDDMVTAAEKVITYTAGLNQAEFVANDLYYDATLRNLELLGEAATHVPDVVRTVQTQIPWRMIVATRNRLIHGYLGIDDDIVWSIIKDDIPALLPQLRKLREQFN